MSHQIKDATIRVRTYDTGWQTIGVDQVRGISHENLQLEWDAWGPLKASFDLRRSPRTPWPDIAAYADVEVEIAGVQVWKGRVQSTPTRDSGDRSINVQCEGMQAHLDDDAYIPFYVHNNLGEWKDGRTDPGASLGTYVAVYQVNVDGGVITMVTPAGQTPTGSMLVYFDAGPGRTIAKVTWTFSQVAFAANSALYVVSGDSFGGLGAGSDNVSKSLASNATDFTDGWTLPTPRRMVGFRIDSNSHTPASDERFKLTDIKLYSSTAYESGGSSVLKASDVVLDAVKRATVLLSSDRTQIQSTTFNIPEFYSADPKTPREVIQAVNAYHNYVTKVDESARMVFKPLPSAPLLEVGDWMALDGSDASQNSGEDIFNKAIVTASTPLSQQLVITRGAAAQPGTPLIPSTSPAASNPGCDSLASWSAYGNVSLGTSSSIYDSAPASVQMTVTGNWGGMTQPTTGTFQAGTTYAMKLAIRGSVAGPSVRVAVNDGTNEVASTYVNVTTSFQIVTLTWTAPLTSSVGNILIDTTYNYTYYVDSIAFYRAAATLIDRRGFARAKRLQVSARLPSDGVAAAQIGDTFLAGHKLAQFKGEYQITGPVREILTGKTVPPEQLGMRTTELLRFSDRIDPDTGAVGRDGRIAHVTYSLADDTATVAIDNTTTSFEALLARLGALTGSG